ncbi:hypothetical protein Emin_0584 [Elusimicrobium minutum Pei191]|uniref:Uncharacterized protein n=1 Tax=Elusimicrobium minutum (strain Pei191) TaxID=445932 RepID=B2KC12_ELUMP|nr:hypothetical protein [Elusimicrobium minutum]ACC98139.1 hypothetical protein Emin_0584 [Elusimicrobium minutum Pei191]
MKLLNKKGLTIAEAVISMVLLATVTMGIYGVIMVSLRSAKNPDMREEMMYALERASAKMKTLVEADLCAADGFSCTLNSTTNEYDCKCVKYVSQETDPAKKPMRRDICDNIILDDTYSPFLTGRKHSVSCLLPEMCDSFNSSFYYEVSNIGLPSDPAKQQYQIYFTLICNGQVL